VFIFAREGDLKSPCRRLLLLGVCGGGVKCLLLLQPPCSKITPISAHLTKQTPKQTAKKLRFTTAVATPKQNSAKNNQTQPFSAFLRLFQTQKNPKTSPELKTEPKPNPNKNGGPTPKTQQKKS
jgi:hypothetical protein